MVPLRKKGKEEAAGSYCVKGQETDIDNPAEPYFSKLCGISFWSEYQFVPKCWNSYIRMKQHKYKDRGSIMEPRTARANNLLTKCLFFMGIRWYQQGDVNKKNLELSMLSGIVE